MIGIYKVTNKINKKFYIGKSKDIEKRWYGYKTFHGQHKRDSYFLRALQKYGPDEFIFEVIEECSLENLNEREKFWIEKLQARNQEIGYNMRQGGDGGDTSKFINYSKVSKSIKKAYKEGRLKSTGWPQHNTCGTKGKTWRVKDTFKWTGNQNGTGHKGFCPGLLDEEKQRRMTLFTEEDKTQKNWKVNLSKKIGITRRSLDRWLHNNT